MATQHEVRKNANGRKPIDLARRKNLRPALEVYWSSVDPVAIRGAIDAVSRAGACVIFSRTSDGGALSICIIDDDEKINKYPHTAEETEQILGAILEAYVDELLG